MKQKSVVIIVTLVIFISFGISTFSSLIFLNKLIEQNSEERAQIFTDKIVESIQETLAESSAVSKSLNNTLVRELICNHEDYSEEDLSDRIGTYLYDITRQFDYDTAFIIADYNRTYYTEWGRMKYLDPDNDDDDWYDNFLETGEAFELNIDNDQANDNRTTVYINIRMEDENGELIGACGVGHVLNSLNEKIDNLEITHDLSILLVSKDGEIQAAGDDSLCTQTASDIARSVMAESDNHGGYYFERYGTSGYRVAKHLDEYRWYLFVEHDDNNDEMSQVLLQDLLACLVSLAIMVIIISIAMNLQEKTSLSFKLDSETDKMTGLLNRRAFDDMLNTVRKADSIKNYSVCAIDVNGLKMVNDSIGHEAGDELIIGAAACITKAFGGRSSAFRIGGDEFALIISEPVDNIESVRQRLKDEMAKWHGEYTDSLSVAIGIVRGCDHEEMSVDELLKLADKEMYRDKEEYYKDKRHERRQR